LRRRTGATGAVEWTRAGSAPIYTPTVRAGLLPGGAADRAGPGRSQGEPEAASSRPSSTSSRRASRDEVEPQPEREGEVDRFTLAQEFKLLEASGFDQSGSRRSEDDDGRS
jgi:hypothetical protein